MRARHAASLALTMAALSFAAVTPAAETPFAPAQAITGGGAQPRAVAVADLDRDGDQDLVIAMQSPVQVVVRLRAADGSYDAAFAIGEITVTPPVTQQLRLADLDDDGDTDIVSVRSTGTVCTARNNGGGSFATFACIVSATRVELADINRDGMRDMVTATSSNGLEWRAGDRSGAFGVPNAINFQRSAAGIAVADFDRDGRLDVARADEGSVNPGISLHRNPATGSTWTSASLFDSAVSALVAIDIDNDGDLDVAGGRCSVTGHVIFRANDGAGNFSSVSGIGIDAPAPGQVPCPRVLAAVDLDRDGRTDLIEADSYGRVLFFHNGSSGFVLERVIADAAAGTSTALHDLAVADLDGDGDADILAAHANENLLAGSENRSLRRGLRSTVLQSGGVSMPGAEALLTGDMDRDGRLDVITASRTDNTVRLLRRTASGFAAPVTLAAGVNAPRGGVIADMNRDGRPDLLLGSPGSGRVMQLFGDGAGGFDTATIAASGLLDTSALLAADLDRDGDLDIVLADAALGQLAWLRNNGNGSYDKRFILGELAAPRAVALADLDRDGWPDLAVAEQSGNRVIGLRNALRDPAAPEFVRVLLSDAPEIAGAQDISLADADRDGVDDLFVNSGTSPLSWLRQTAPGVFGASQAIPTAGSGSGMVHAGDIDGDAQVDVVDTHGNSLFVRSGVVSGDGVGGYSVSSSQPRVAVTVADLDANGVADIADISGTGALTLRLTDASQVRARGSILTLPFARRYTDLRLATLILSHDGRAGDDDAQPRRIGYTLRRTNSAGALLSGSEYSQLFTQVRLFGDDGDGVFEPGVDPLLATAGAAGFDAGVLSFAIPAPQQAPFAAGASARFHFVAQVTAGADQVTRVLHISASSPGTEAVNAAYATRVDISADTSGTTLDLETIFRSRFE